jgi:type VI secretion system protein ImpM
MEKCLMESQAGLDPSAWVAMFAAAPIWRFFLGAGLCGATIRGAFMPSMDAIGRYFPLTIVAWPEHGVSLDPPGEDPQFAWFERVEELLLSTLKSDVSMEIIAAGLGQLEAVAAPAAPPAVSELLFLPADATSEPQPLRQIFDVMTDDTADDDKATRSDAPQMTFWWTLGEKTEPAWAWHRKFMPDPSQFTAMLTGRFTPPLQDISYARP